MTPILLIVLCGSSDGTGGVPITPPPPPEAAEPKWLVSPVFQTSRLILIREDD